MSMTWREFERYCEDLITESLDPDRYRITPQYEGEYGGVIKRMDFHIAEKRRGGKSLRCRLQTFQKSSVPIREIETTREYQRLCKAILVRSSL